MKVVIIRHAEVIFRWEKRYTSDGFDRACSEYDAAPVRSAAYKLPEVSPQTIYISTLRRSLDTARALFPGETYVQTGFVDEVPLRSCFDSSQMMPLWFWNVAGRLQWAWGSTRQAEGYRETRKRARKFIRKLCRDGTDCAVITHGFYMHTLLSEMKKAGFKTDRSRVKYKNGECVVAER